MRKPYLTRIIQQSVLASRRRGNIYRTERKRYDNYNNSNGPQNGQNESELEKKSSTSL